MHVGTTVKEKLIEEQGKENEFAKGVNQAMGKPDKKRQFLHLRSVIFSFWALKCKSSNPAAKSVCAQCTDCEAKVCLPYLDLRLSCILKVHLSL